MDWIDIQIKLCLLDRMCVFRHYTGECRTNLLSDLYRHQCPGSLYLNRFGAYSHNTLILHGKQSDKHP